MNLNGTAMPYENNVKQLENTIKIELNIERGNGQNWIWNTTNIITCWQDFSISGIQQITNV